MKNWPKRWSSGGSNKSLLLFSRQYLRIFGFYWFLRASFGHKSENRVKNSNLAQKLESEQGGNIFLRTGTRNYCLRLAVYFGVGDWLTSKWLNYYCTCTVQYVSYSSLQTWTRKWPLYWLHLMGCRVFIRSPNFNGFCVSLLSSEKFLIYHKQSSLCVYVCKR